MSILEQTVPPDNFVIVADGPLTDGLNAILDSFEMQFPDIFHILRLSQNEGQGIALKKGLVLCKHEIVARMDSDDISIPERCDLQLSAFEENPDIALVGGQIEEFEADLSQPYAKRSVPLSNGNIYKFAQKRNPFNHMTVMFKKSVILDAGNYQSFPLFEDYWLWVRVLIRGAPVCNLPQVLVKARAGKGMIVRRGGVAYVKKQIAFQKAIYEVGFTSRKQLLFNLCVRVGAGIAPGWVRDMIYKNVLRKDVAI